MPVLERLPASFSCVVQGFHSGNGSKYVNYQVAVLLEKLRVAELTKPPPRRTKDNALAASKNGSVIRCGFGHGHTYICTPFEARKALPEPEGGLRGAVLESVRADRPRGGREPRLVAHTAYGASQDRQVPPAWRRSSAIAALLTSAWVA